MKKCTMILALGVLLTAGGHALFADDAVPQLAPLPEPSANNSVIPLPAAPSAATTPAAESAKVENLPLPAAGSPPMLQPPAAEEKPLSAAEPAANGLSEIKASDSRSAPPELPQLQEPSDADSVKADAAKASEESVGAEKKKEKSASAAHGKKTGKKTSGKTAKHKKKHGKKRSKAKAVKSKGAKAAPIQPVIRDRLPAEIYRKSYSRANSHLPIALYEQDLEHALFAAAADDDINGLRSLLNRGLDVDMVDGATGDTPLLAAVRHNARNAALLLLKRNANRYAQDSGGMTALDLANQSGNAQMVRTLTMAGLLD